MPANDLQTLPLSEDVSSHSDVPEIPHLSPDALTRRALLRRLSGGALALASAGILAGCGGGGGGGGGSNGGGGGGGGTTPGTVSGTVNTAQIGGSNLRAQSVYQTDVLISSGKFTIKVSTQGAQSLLVSDVNGQVRGLAISLPTASSLTVDATSTALALVFLTPGILATDPTVAAQRLSQIAALSSFAPLMTFLSTNLPANTIPPLLQAGTLSALVYTCVTDWFHAQTGSIKLPNVSNGFGFSATLGSLANLSVVPVALSNQELRSLNVVRRYVDGNGNDVGTPQQVFDALEGAQNLSLTSLFSTGSPTAVSDTANVSASTIAAVQYWVRGPGSSTASQTLPASITSSDTNAWVVSSLIDLLVPLLQCALGLSGTDASSLALQDITAAWEQNSISLNISQVITDFAGKNVQSAGNDLVKSILMPLANNSALVQALIQVLAKDVSGASSLTLSATPILHVFTLMSAVFDYTTCAGALTHWFALPHISSVTLPVTNGGITVS